MENHQTLQEILVIIIVSQRILAYNTGTILKQWPDIIPIYWEF